MTVPLVLRPIHAPPVTPKLVASPSGRSLGSIVAAASDAVASIPVDDPRWDALGPQLTIFIQSTRLAAGMPMSPIRPDEVVTAVLRLRDLARLAQLTAATGGFATTQAEADLRSLQIAAASR